MHLGRYEMRGVELKLVLVVLPELKHAQMIFDAGWYVHLHGAGHVVEMPGWPKRLEDAVI
jgi:hypothetical protein